MWKPIYQPEPWPQYLKRRDNVGVPLMEVRKKYMEEQLLFENYISSMKHLNVLSPALAGVGAASGGGPSVPSVPGGGRESDLFFEAEYIVGNNLNDVTLRFFSGWGPFDSASLRSWNDEVVPVSASNLWKYPYAEVGTNYPGNWDPSNTIYGRVTQSVLPTPDSWVKGIPPDVDGRDIFVGAYNYSQPGNPSINYDDYLNGVYPQFGIIRAYNKNAYTYLKRGIATGIDWVLENPIRIDWGDGNINNYSGDQAEPYGFAVGPWALEQGSEPSASWSPASASIYEYNNVASRHYYNPEDIMPEEWVSVLPEPEFLPSYRSNDNRNVRFAMEAAATSSGGNYPWGSPYNNWFDFNQQKTTVKIYGNPNIAGDKMTVYDNYATAPKKINFWDTSGYTSYANLFRGTTGVDITPLDIANWDTSNVTNMTSMFQESQFTLGKGIKQNSLANWNTSNVTSMASMFYSRQETDGKDPEIGNWDVSNVISFSSMFYNAPFGGQYESCNLSDDLTNWNVRGDASVSTMFFNCGALQTPTNFNNWNISGSTSVSYAFGRTSFNQALTNWELGDGCDARGIFNKVGLSHTGFWDTLKAWASGSASNVNTHTSYYPNQLGYTPSRTYSKKVDSVSGEQIPIAGHIHTPTDSAINYSDFYKWFANHTRNTNITCISGSTNHQAYETLVNRGWTMGAIDIIATGSIASERITQLPINVTVDSGNFVISSSYFTPVSELQPYDNYDPLYTPTLTYRFDQSDSSNTNHPLKLSTTLDGTHGGGTEYTVDVTYNGTPGTSGSYTDVMVSKLNGFEVESKPKLYVYCQNHSGMSNFYLEAYT